MELNLAYLCLLQHPTISPSPPLSTSVHAPQLAHTSTEQYRADQTRTEQQPEMVTIHCPRPPSPLPPHYRPHASSIELPLCEGRLEIEDSGLWWGWANITIASRQQKPALATPQLIDTSYDTHTHCKKSKLNKSRRWCLITSNKINSSTLWFPTANSCKDYKTGFTSVFNVRWGCYLELRSI